MIIETEDFRYLLGPCLRGDHKRCPGTKNKEIYKKEGNLGPIPTGKTKQVFCECSCHATVVK